MSESKLDALFSSVRGSQSSFSIRDLDLDAFADGIAAHRSALGFHECPFPQASLAALSWRMGWNERALAKRD